MPPPPRRYRPWQQQELIVAAPSRTSSGLPSVSQIRSEDFADRWHNDLGYHSFMNLLLVGDGSTYIDLTKAQEFRMRGVTYYKSQGGAWVRKERKSSSGQAITDREAFRAFMNAHMFAEAKTNFPELFEEGFKVEAVNAPSANPMQVKTWPALRFAAAGFVALLLVAYVVAIVMGKISANRHINLADFAIIVIGFVIISVLFRPQLARYVQRFEFGTFRFELRDQLREIQDTQRGHGQEINEIRFVLEALVTSKELEHLKHLAHGPTANYQRHESLQAELRRLRSIGLINSKRYIAQMPERFDLSEWVELTDRGADYLRRVEKAHSTDAASSN